MAFPNRLERNTHRGRAIRERLMTVGGALLALAIAPSASALSSTASIDLTSPDGSTERIALAGTSTLSITSGVTNPDGMADQFDIELGPLVLTGTSFVFGALTLTVAGAPSSVGLVRELSNGTPGWSSTRQTAGSTRTSCWTSLPSACSTIRAPSSW